MQAFGTFCTRVLIVRIVIYKLDAGLYKYANFLQNNVIARPQMRL